MYVSPSELKSCLDKAQELLAICETYPNFKTESERDVFVLQEAASKLLKAPIEIIELDIYRADTPVFGNCMPMSDGSFQINHVSGLSYCWTRFVICKELFHALIDDPKYRRLDVETHLDNLTLAFPDHESKADLASVSEFLTEVAAMEFLFPYKLRLEELATESPNFKDLSKKYRVPQVHVDKYLGAPYMENLKMSAQ